MDTATLIYLVGGAVSAAIILAFSKRREGPDPMKVRLKGLVTGYGCSNFEFSPSFPRGVVSAGFEGKWSCCRLGCGGWGCAYLCTNGKEKAVFKTPKGFEKSLKKARSHPRLLQRI